MSCLYTKLIKNPKYLPSKKNGYNPPICEDGRLLYVPVSCGKCYECRKKKKREWTVRLCEEIKRKKAYFITLTLSNESFFKLRKGNESENDICTLALRRWLERVRKETKKSVKHWFITELGEEKGRIHLHGIIFTENISIVKKWTYGHVFVGQFVNERTINYITKYMLKENPIDKSFIGKVLCSKGIGKEYITEYTKERNRYRKGNTKETYMFRNGSEIYLPEYYRNKLYNEKEKESLWIEKIEKGVRYIGGVAIKTDNEKELMNALNYWRERNINIHGDNEQEWEKDKYINRQKRLNKYRKKAAMLLRSANELAHLDND